MLIPSGTQLAQVTVAGEIDVGSMNGSSAMAAALQGADLKIIGNSGNKMIFSLYVRPEIKTIEALKGKKDRHHPFWFCARYFGPLRA